MKLGKTQKALIISALSLVLLSLVLFLLYKFAGNNLILVSCIVFIWTIFVTVVQGLAYKKLKADIEKEMPLYLVELYNGGVISKEDALNPTSEQKKMFFAEFKRSLNTKLFFLIFVAFVGVYLGIQILLI